MTPPIVLRLREAASSLRDERVSMRMMAQALGPEAHGTLLLLLACPACCRCLAWARCSDLGWRHEPWLWRALFA